MSIAAGSVTIASDGSASGSGAAKALYDYYVTKLGDLSTVSISVRVQILQGAADLCMMIAQLVPYITANAVVAAGTLKAHVTTQQLGRDNTGGNPAILAPAAPVDVPLTGTGTIG